MKRSKKIAASILSVMIFSSLVISASASAKEAPEKSVPQIISTQEKDSFLTKSPSISLTNAIDPFVTDNDNLPLLDTTTPLSSDVSQLTEDSSISFPMKSRGLFLIQYEIGGTSGQITSSNPQDGYFMDLPASRSLVYGLGSNNPNLRVHFCTYDASVGTISSTGYYADAGKAAAINGVPAGRYALLVTDKSNKYVSDASYTLYTNSSVSYRSGMSFSHIASDLSAVMTYVGNDVYINNNRICWIGAGNSVNYSKTNYASPYQNGLSIAQSFLEENAQMYGITINNVSPPFQYFSERKQTDIAVLLYFGTGNIVRFTEYSGGFSNPTYKETVVLTDKDPQDNFIVYDYVTGEYFDMYLGIDQIPVNHRLIYRTISR